MLSCRSEASFLRITESSSCSDNPKLEEDAKQTECNESFEYNLDDSTVAAKDHHSKLRLPFGDWFHQPSPKHSHENVGISREGVNKEDLKQNTFLPKITMVGFSTEEAGQMSKASLKKTMDDLTKELEKTEGDNQTVGGSNDCKLEDRDPLFVANVGDYYSSVGRTGSPRWIRGGSN